MKIGIVCDHAGFQLKKALFEHLVDSGYEITDYGCFSECVCDYPLQADLLCDGFKKDKLDLGIAICGTGVGMSIACNKHKDIRACCCSEEKSARLSREHNDANILCIGARIIDSKLAIKIVDTFVNTPFSNDERHVRRIEEIRNLEK